MPAALKRFADCSKQLHQYQSFAENIGFQYHTGLASSTQFCKANHLGDSRDDEKRLAMKRKTIITAAPVWKTIAANPIVHFLPMASDVLPPAKPPNKYDYSTMTPTSAKSRHDHWFKPQQVDTPP
ncbi:hypothetical protein HAX54_002030 [Datura stramonium]|uniref:Uncharacterized protein n=1 Tax=Datura stramonium TaxID=4076 RepID=A0ABS8T406_DATST|nr:hypothetical protein [Datura stramonium]